jgi:hypothetical protein
MAIYHLFIRINEQKKLQIHEQQLHRREKKENKNSLSAVCIMNREEKSKSSYEINDLYNFRQLFVVVRPKFRHSRVIFGCFFVYVLLKRGMKKLLP